MKLIKPEVEILSLADPVKMVKGVESIARKCYQSSHAITEDSFESFVRKLIDSGHHSTLEHMSFTITFVTDRGISHELVRHRLCAISQESTRYANYSKDRFGNEIAVLEPFFFEPTEETRPILLPVIDNETGKIMDDIESADYSYMNSFDVWFLTCAFAQWGYLTLINEFKRSPQEARSVLPNSLKTEIAVSCNLREWRHIFNMRAYGISGTPHPQMREIMVPALEKCYETFPVVFDDIYMNSKQKGLFDNKYQTVSVLRRDI